MSSSTSSTAPSKTSSGSSSPTATSVPGTGSSSEPLYLFTFLATLFLLLFVSAAIVFRSFILRRRFRRRIEEALAAGTLLTPTLGGLPGLRRKLERPRLWDVTLMPAAKEGWGEALPVAANVAASRPALPSDDVSSKTDPNASTSRLAMLRRPFARRQTSMLSTPSSPDPLSPNAGDVQTPHEDALARAEAVQVAVIINMPNPHRPAPFPNSAAAMSPKGKERSVSGYWDEEEEGVPDVVLGLARVPCRGFGTRLESIA